MTSKEKVLGVYPTACIKEGPPCNRNHWQENTKSLSLTWPFGFTSTCVITEDELWDDLWEKISDEMLRKLEQ